LAREMVLDMEQKGDARLKVLGAPLKFSESHPAPPRPAPVVGEDSVEILKSAGYTPERIRELIASGVVYAGDSKIGRKQ
jgi:crotonobetainyl-CoA:carnitine CoA-transferase CaiB-like acyl-CoA transferase